MLFYISIFVLPLIIWIILQSISKRKQGGEAASVVPLEECALCHQEFRMDELIEKEVGGYSKVYCFCGGCIGELYDEYQAKIEQETSRNEPTSEPK